MKAAILILLALLIAAYLGTLAGQLADRVKLSHAAQIEELAR